MVLFILSLKRVHFSESFSFYVDRVTENNLHISMAVKLSCVGFSALVLALGLLTCQAELIGK